MGWQQKNGVCMFLAHNSILGYLSQEIVHKGKRIHLSSCSFTILIIFARDYKQLSIVGKWLGLL